MRHRLTSSQARAWLYAALLAAWVLICYGFALRLPFFFDDMPVLRWVDSHNLQAIWSSRENGYYRPLTFMLYKYGLFFPPGVQQYILHTTNLVLHWLNALLFVQLVKCFERREESARLAGALFVAFPFLTDAVPWITTLPHFLATFLTLLALYTALRAEAERRFEYWGVVVAAVALAPLTHESGAVSAAIVGGILFLQYGLKLRWRLGWILLGGFLNVAAVLSRALIPGGRTVSQLGGLQDLPQNLMFFLQGLIYPIAPGVTWLVDHAGGQDFVLLGGSAIGFFMVMAVLAYCGRDWRWGARSLWWWLLGGLPAALSLRYARLFISPRLYMMAAPGIVLLWTGLIVRLAALCTDQVKRQLVEGILVGVILIQNFGYIRHERTLYTQLDRIYDRVLAAASDVQNAPLGFVNLPVALEWGEKRYPLTKDAVVFVPSNYAKVEHFLATNLGEPAPLLTVAAFSPVAQKTDPIWLSNGSWLEWDELYQFALDHETVWLCRYEDDIQQFSLNYVGGITAGENISLGGTSRIHFEKGPDLLAVSAVHMEGNTWSLALDWQGRTPVDATIFVHIIDRSGNLVTQADGMALGGMVPLWAWREGDRLHDVRVIAIPSGAACPCTVRVGLYNEVGRIPAFMENQRCPDDAALVAEIP